MNAHHLLHLFLYLTVVSIGFCKVTNITDFVPEVNIDKLGKVRGRVTMSHWTKRLIYSFQGIPYAIPPVGKMRFQVSTKLLYLGPFSPQKLYLLTFSFCTHFFPAKKCTHKINETLLKLLG